MIHPIRYIIEQQRKWEYNNYDRTKFGSRIASLKNTHSGDMCFIIGNGPSLRPKDLDVLQSNRVDSFAANRIYKIFDKSNWRPKYYLCEDPTIMMEIESEINKVVTSEVKLIPIDLKWYKNINIRDAYYFNMQYAESSSYNYGYYDDLAKYVTCNGTVTITAIQFAIFMGYKNIYLIGVDHNYSQMVDNSGTIIIDNNVKNYFDDSYESEFQNKITRNIENSTLAFERLSEYAKTRKVNIFNATRGGKLEAFQRVDFDSIF